MECENALCVIDRQIDKLNRKKMFAKYILVLNDMEIKQYIVYITY